MANLKIQDIQISDPFIYRIDPEDYISLTENLIINRKLFNEIENAGKSTDVKLVLKHSSILKKWRDNPAGKAREIYREFEVYRYFYKEVGASLKFNPLSEKKAGVFILNRIHEFLKKYITLIKPKVVYKFINIIPDSEGLQVKDTDVHFDSRKLKIFTSHSSLKSEKEITPGDLVNEKVVVYVVSIGPGIDNEVKSLADAGDVFDAYLLNGIGAGAAEMVANDLNLFMNDSCKENNYEYKRLSPGYGDWHITDQEKIFKLLNPEKNIGVKLTDTHIMLPEKSTSGIMGLISSQSL
ncbi:MAG: hypothetical protein EHM47_07045 [Ignavibacteriales bacterium]|nr:MAG: hypothetical protein EHM47_07045 [Ignavibacteriales bacterium]